MEKHWLERTATIRALWIVFILLLAGCVAFDFSVEHHPYFKLDGTIGFGAWYGFVSCVALVLGAKAIGWILKRADTYYDD